MRKTYPLNVEGKHRDRLLDAAKHDIRKYVRRERGRDLPAGVDYWDFDCKFGPSEDQAEPVHFAALMGAVDALVQAGGEQFYVEIVTRHGLRAARPQGAGGPDDSDEPAD